MLKPEHLEVLEQATGLLVVVGQVVVEQEAEVAARVAEQEAEQVLKLPQLQRVLRH
jgi:hypothetical protein